MVAVCPSKSEIEAFVLAQMDADSASRFAEHLEDCSACEQALANLEQLQLGRFHGLNYGETLTWSMNAGDAARQFVVSTTLDAKRGPLQLARLSPGETIGDSRLIRELGAGGFGRVFLAEQISMRRFAALKVAKRRSQEPELLASLDHPHIVRVFHYDDRLSEHGLHLLYMQYVPGCNLRKVINRLAAYPQCEWSGKLLLRIIRQANVGIGSEVRSMQHCEIESLDWPSTVCWIGARLADALRYSHSRNVLHRDVKPANVLLSESGEPYLVDFNVGFSGDFDGVSPEESFGGSLPYMSPEHLSAFALKNGAGSVGPESDVYALGIVLWELLTGARPFSDDIWRGSTTLIVAQRVARAATQSPASGLREGTPHGLEAVLRMALAAKPEQRVPTAELTRYLELYSLGNLRNLLFPAVPGWGMRLMVFLAYLLAGQLSILVFIGYSIQHQFEYALQLEGWDPAYLLHRETAVVVGAAHAIGTACLIGYLWQPLSTALRRRIERIKADSSQAEARCLMCGPFTCLVVFILWIFSGVALVTWNDVAGVNTSISFELAFNFVTSHLFYGLVSSIFVGLLTTYATVRVLYPPLIPYCESKRAQVHLARLRWFLGGSTLLLALTPNLGLLLLAASASVKFSFILTIGITGTFGLALAGSARHLIESRLSEIQLALNTQFFHAQDRTSTTRITPPTKCDVARKS
jgi:serine/threonine protein kinase